jgi:hypothetical protein
MSISPRLPPSTTSTPLPRSKLSSRGCKTLLSSWFPVNNHGRCMKHGHFDVGLSDASVCCHVCHHALSTPQGQFMIN